MMTLERDKGKFKEGYIMGSPLCRIRKRRKIIKKNGGIV